jgi:hypothetical protein
MGPPQVYFQGLGDMIVVGHRYRKSNAYGSSQLRLQCSDELLFTARGCNFGFDARRYVVFELPCMEGGAISQASLKILIKTSLETSSIEGPLNRR